MKIIDRKGKLFGIINIVDLLVLVLIIGLIVVIGVRFKSQKLNANGGSPITEKEEVYVTLYASLVVPEIAENLKIGDKLVANNAYTTAEIVDIKVEPAAYVSTNSEGKATLSEHPLWKDVTVVIKDTVNPSSVILKAANQEVRVGYSFILKTQTVETNTKIRGVEFGNYSLESEKNSEEEITNEEILEEVKETEENSTENIEINQDTSNITSEATTVPTNTSNYNNHDNTQATSTQTIITSVSQTNNVQKMTNNINESINTEKNTPSNQQVNSINIGENTNLIEENISNEQINLTETINQTYETNIESTGQKDLQTKEEQTLKTEEPNLDKTLNNEN